MKPTEKVPNLNVRTLDGVEWDIRNSKPDFMTMVVFYRGLHCPICKGYLTDLQNHLDKFRDLSVETIAISSDSEGRARKTKEEWGLGQLKLGYGLSIESARNWGLFVSKGIKAGEPEIFSEPGLYLVQPDQTLYAGMIQTMPFARPRFPEILGALSFIKSNHYPARGEA